MVRAHLATWRAVAQAGLLVALAACPALGQMEIDTQQEYNVKAVYLYSFGRYVVWPEASMAEGEPFVIGVLGSDPFAGALDQIAQKKQIGGRRIVIRRFSSPEQYRPCHILFLPRTVPAEQQAAMIDKLRSQSVLLAGEIPGFIERGGTVNFFVTGGTVRFEINVAGTKQQGLSVDAKLLSLARTVKGT